MNTISLQVENIKCGGCSSKIKRELHKIEPDVLISVNINEGVISISSLGEINKYAYLDKLKHMGYPEKGIGNVFDKAKSYVSCMIGKIG